MSQKSTRRIQNDIKMYHKSDLNDHGIYVHFNEKNIYNAKALIIGPKETPYQNGYFFFDINFTERYPQEPPKVLLCTLNKRTRFNPNLYTGGKVCLSILGTWSGPGWTPCLSTSEVLLSIQSLMNSNPIQNEPGYEELTVDNSPEAKKYVQLIEYHNALIAIVQMIEDIPPSFSCFKELIESKFCEFYKENMEFLEKMNKSSVNDKNVYLKMYNLEDRLQYTKLILKFKEIYSNLSPIYCENPIKVDEETPAIEQLCNYISDPGAGKKRVPSSSPSNYEVGYIMVSDNDSREYIVKEVAGKGGNLNKRWILNK
jgi:ubiquitin-protein ligase